MDPYEELANAVVELAVRDYRRAKKKISSKTEFRELAKYEEWAGKHIAEMLEREVESGIIPEDRLERFRKRRGLWGGQNQLIRVVVTPFIRDRKLQALRTMQEVADFLKHPAFEHPADTRMILRRLEREPYGRRHK